jgi:hypothetical protein
MRCSTCGGELFYDDGEKVCLNCGRGRNGRLLPLSVVTKTLSCCVGTVYYRAKRLGISPGHVEHRPVFTAEEVGKLKNFRGWLHTVDFPDGTLKVANSLVAENLPAYSRRWLDELVAGGVVSGFMMSGFCWSDWGALAQYLEWAPPSSGPVAPVRAQQVLGGLTSDAVTINGRSVMLNQ